MDEYNTNITDIITIGAHTFCTSDPTVSYTALDKGDSLLHDTNQQHGHQSWYKHISGSDIHVFFTETEGDGSLPSDDSFWMNFFKPRIGWSIYQGVLDYSSNIGINATDILDKMAPHHPRETKSTAIDHEALRLFFCYLLTSRIKKSSANYFLPT